jgi:hypothetical protein
MGKGNRLQQLRAWGKQSSRAAQKSGKRDGAAGLHRLVDPVNDGARQKIVPAQRQQLGKLS